MPSESEPVYVEPAPEAQLDSSKAWLCKKAFQRLTISPQAWGLHSKQKINDMSYNWLISDPLTYVKRRGQRSDDSILWRRMDDVVVMRHEGDTANFLGLEVTKTSKGFEVENSTDLVEPLYIFTSWKTRNRRPILVDARQ